jgi:hypothetical protein
MLSALAISRRANVEQSWVEWRWDEALFACIAWISFGFSLDSTEHSFLMEGDEKGGGSNCLYR